jgi:prolyl-tRNA editing enzyme YbaK/EbsC (Cys-tRNA(Pro) deacylase)
LSASAAKVQSALQASGFDCRVRELPKPTRTAREAADAAGCEVGQIVKSLVWRRKRSGLPLLVVASGVNRVDEKKVAEAVGEPVDMADPEFVRRHTGFAIGGVPPLGHPQKLECLVDQDLLGYERLWAAAGNPRALFSLMPEELVHMTEGRVIAIASAQR